MPANSPIRCYGSVQMPFDPIRRKGVAVLYLVVAFALICLLVSFGVDLGRVQLAKTELQRATDAAARYAVTGLMNNTAVAKAISAGGNNAVDGSAVVIASADVIQGNWDATKTP